MLYKELQKIIATIEFYDNKEGWRSFVDELMDRNVTSLKGLRTGSDDREKLRVMQWTKMAVGAGWYGRLIKPLPVIIEIMAEVLQDRNGPAYTRAALAGALAYLVQQYDLIPDEADGGYGLVDDAIVMYYTYKLYLQHLGNRAPEVKETMDKYSAELETVIKTGLRIFPKSRIGDLKRVLSNIAMGFYHLNEVPSYILEQMVDQIIQNPRKIGTEQMLSRLAYHLDVNFQSYPQSVYSDPVLSLLDVMEAELGASPGDLVPGSFFY